ncbi:M24 family metallopeptidase [Sphingomonas sanguinis]|jgi:Xaa-Pro dipeptidase|uniref:Aminopeptidase P family protein n=1 Tax=Sphingomonas sanguinis TaxID=33051 RepID=A0A7Y7QT30_9SPHN|nr:Xaa-Pro peptidase family protein [Sphingomonas sanguinis]MBZ6380841.1 Xaa-Pro peptidase family protein [Sphingomonas sanguinis]NNG49347.1 aminopeptidase P family protein [Sphingomonas sanguinis]NNG53475.1 aminopeptidase P family protein [Sphingomonas sanguinis]NVP30144.1 aminopeptidase P family protein [Sphingomonas sanguinis]
MAGMIGGSTAERELASLSPWANPAPVITAQERARRMDRARELTAQMGADALLIGAGASLRYFTGVAWGATERLVAMLLPVKGDPIFICPAFELGSFEASLSIPATDIRLWEEDESPSALVADALNGAKTLAIDPALAFLFVDRIRQAAPGVSLVSGAAVVDGCRAIKSPAEIALMSQAMDITLEVHRRAARILHEGIRASEVIRFIDQAHRALGASTGNYFCAVQFGRSTAFPHGLPQDDVLRDGDLVLVDTGTLIDGYHSDITRTYAFGEVGDEIRRIWDIEKEAQAAAFAAVRPGEPCESVDYAARVVLDRSGLGPDYRLPGLPHRTGHGIGLSIHEPAYLVRGDKTPLTPGMCFSNEPMIVVPDRFGVRLEDHFHVTETGAAWFTEPQPAIDDLG